MRQLATSDDLHGGYRALPRAASGIGADSFIGTEERRAARPHASSTIIGLPILSSLPARIQICGTNLDEIFLFFWV
jgi:hypothetical protein